MKNIAEGPGSTDGRTPPRVRRLDSGRLADSQRFVVFFVSQRCSMRSVLAASCLMHLCEERFVAYACGNPHHLAREVHPAAIGALASAGIRVGSEFRRNWDELSHAGLRRADFIITLDENTLAKQPRWPGQPNSALWTLPDIAEISDPEALARASIQALYILRRRLELLVNLPLRSADRAALQLDVRDLAFMS